MMKILTKFRSTVAEIINFLLTNNFVSSEIMCSQQNLLSENVKHFCCLQNSKLLRYFKAKHLSKKRKRCLEAEREKERVFHKNPL